MRKALMVVLLALAVGGTACSHNGKDPEPTPPEPPVQETNLDKAEENLRRSLTLTQSALEHCFKGNSMLMMRYYYPFIGTTSLEKASVWMYTSSLEAVNALLSGMEDLKEAGRPELYDTNSEALKKTLGDLFDGLDWYKGTYTLTSYTQTKEWSVYGVNRGNSPGTAKVEGVEYLSPPQSPFKTSPFTIVTPLFNFSAFFLRYLSASSYFSRQKVCAFVSRATVIPIQPVPEQRSSTFLSFFPFNFSMQKSTSVSVSNLGIRTPGPTEKSLPKNDHTPVIYWSGYLIFR